MNTNTLQKASKNKVFLTSVAALTGFLILVSMAPVTALAVTNTSTNGQFIASLLNDNNRICHQVGDPTDSIVRNGVISWDVNFANNSNKTVTISRIAYHDPVSGCAATFVDGQNLLTSTAKSVFAPGETGTGNFAYNINSYNCGRVQLDGGWSDSSGQVGPVFIGTVINYGHDCVTSTPIPVPTPAPTPTPTPAPVQTPAPVARVITSIQPSAACSGNQVSIFGSNLDQTVQAFDSGAARYTTKDTNRINAQLTTVNYTVNLPVGDYQLRVGPNLFDVSNLVAFKVLNCNPTPTPVPTPAPTPTPVPTPVITPTPTPTATTIINNSNVTTTNTTTITQNGNGNVANVNNAGVINQVGNGSNAAQQNYAVVSFAASTPYPTPASIPGSVSIYASPSTICAGQASTLTWSSNNASNISIDQGIGSVGSTGSRTVYPYQTTNYLITAYSSQGQYTSASTTVYVNGNCYQPTPTNYPTPYPTPYPNQNMSVQKFVRNLSRGDASYQSSVTARPGETVQFEIVIGTANYNTLYNVVASDVLPAGLSYVPGSARVNNALINDSFATSYGVVVGNISNTSQDVITFSAKVSTGYAAGKTFTNVASARADNTNPVNSQPAYVTVQGNVVAGALHVKTGAPMDISIALAVLAALGATGWYAIKKGMFSSVLA